MLAYLLVMLFVLGLIVGSMLNVCIHRLPLEKSIMWPGSRCSHCLQPIRWYDNIPLVSYLVLRGRCRTCGASFSMRYLLVELLTGIAFSGLFYLEVWSNIHQIAGMERQREFLARLYLPSWSAWAVFGFHAILVSFLIVASFCDLDYREIPLSVTLPGTAVGLLGSVLAPWPWPANPAPAPASIASPQAWMFPEPGIQEGLYAWPFWGPLPDSFPPGSWQTGLATGIAGLAVGWIMLWIVRYLFGIGSGIEALGLGDADLMMMGGSFLGWQPIIVAFVIGVFAGLIFGVVQLVVHRDNAMPFGPSLAAGIVITFLCWHWIGPNFQHIFFNWIILVILGGVSTVLMLVLSTLLRVIRL
jgi:leader peptidase (prepilin peptidase)/N-methyltransferase